MLSKAYKNGNPSKLTQCANYNKNVVVVKEQTATIGSVLQLEGSWIFIKFFQMVWQIYIVYDFVN